MFSENGSWEAVRSMSRIKAVLIKEHYKSKIKQVLIELVELPLPAEVGNGHEQECVWFRWENTDQSHWVTMRLGWGEYTLEASMREDNKEGCQESGLLEYKEMGKSVSPLLKLVGVVDPHIWESTRQLATRKLIHDTRIILETNEVTVKARVDMLICEIQGTGLPPPDRVELDKTVVMWKWEIKKPLKKCKEKEKIKLIEARGEGEIWVQIDRFRIDVSTSDKDGREFVKHTEAVAYLLERWTMFAN